MAGIDNSQQEQEGQEQEGQEEQEVKGRQSDPVADEAKRQRELNQKLKAQLTDLEKKHATFASMYKDIDPDEVKALRTKMEEAERKAAERDPGKMEELFEKKIRKNKEEYEEKISSITAELEKSRKQVKTLAVTDRVMTDITSLFHSDAIRFIKREVEESCDLDEDGNIVIYDIFDENRGVLYRGHKPATVKEFGEMLAEKYPSLAKSSGSSGSRDATQGHKTGPGRGNRVPQTWAELQAMPNAREVLEKLKKEDPAAVTRILKSYGK